MNYEKITINKSEVEIYMTYIRGVSKNRVLANMDMVDMMFLFCWFIIASRGLKKEYI